MKCNRKNKHGNRICNGEVVFTNTELCEDCWAEAQERFHGRPQRVSTEQPSLVRHFSDDELFNQINLLAI